MKEKTLDIIMFLIISILIFFTGVWTFNVGYPIIGVLEIFVSIVPINIIIKKLVISVGTLNAQDVKK